MLLNKIFQLEIAHIFEIQGSHKLFLKPGTVLSIVDFENKGTNQKNKNEKMEIVNLIKFDQI